MHERPSWDDYFMQIAMDVATRSTCLRRQVGAVIVRERRILTTGYNGAPKGLPHCLTAGCHIVAGHCIRCLHAEQNAIIQGAYVGVCTEGAVLYCTHQPCNMCAKMIVNAGITKVMIGGDYPDEYALEVFNTVGIPVVIMDLPSRQVSNSDEAPSAAAQSS
jgi:dCMP deaminase